MKYLQSMGVLYTEKRFFAILLPMYEIELKAHVYNRDELIPKLNADARYLGTVGKNDTCLLYTSPSPRD